MAAADAIRHVVRAGEWQGMAQKRTLQKLPPEKVVK
jgi:hypothetical protein